MTYVKRILSIILVLALVCGLLPATAMAAQETESSIGNDEATLQGSNGFGELLVEDINKKQETEHENSDGFEAGFSVSQLEIEGNVATVTYETQETANLVVAIYTEDGLRLVTSGNAVVEPENTTATVTIAGTMPQFFMAAAYLVDTYDMAPLCAAYETPMYTQEMQELLASTVDDYIPDKVLNLDDDSTTNFAVFSETTKVIRYAEGVNTVISADEATSTYVIGNADSQFTGLQAGDVVAYAYGDNDILIVKVARISINGTTVTLTGAEVEMEEVFEAVKIEVSNPSDNIHLDESTVGEGLIFEGYRNENVPSTRLKDEGEISHSLEFSIGYDVISAGDFKVNISGSLSLSVTMSFEYYITRGRQFVDFRIEKEIEASFAISAKYTFEFPLGVILCPIIPGVVDVTLTPTLEIAVGAKLEVSMSYSKTVGFVFDSESDPMFTKIDEKPDYDWSVDASGTITVTINLSPELKILCGVAKFGASLYVGVEIAVTRELYGPINQDKRHECQECMTIKSSFVFGIDLNMTLLWVFETEYSLLEIKRPLANMYYSKDLNRLDDGSCPNVSYRTTVEVLDHKGKPVPYVEISDTVLGNWGQTQNNGVVIEYLPAGETTISARIAGVTLKRPITVTEAGKVKLTLPENVNDAVVEEVAQKNFADLMAQIDPAVKAQLMDNGKVIASGVCGADGANVAWALYASGLLRIAGNGSMKDYEYSSDVPWYSHRTKIASVEVMDGVASLGTYAFYGCDALTAVLLPDSLTVIGDYAFQRCETLMSIKIPTSVNEIGGYAFADCTALTSVTVPGKVTVIDYGVFNGCTNLASVTLPKGITNIMNHAFRECGSLESIVIPDAVTEIGTYAFYKCSALTAVTVPENVISIGDYAFAACSGLISVTMHDTLKTIGAGAFNGCSALTGIRIPADVTDIGENAFYGCAAMTDIWFSDGVIAIGASAFNGCNALVNVHLTDLNTWLAMCKAGSANPLNANTKDKHLYLNGERMTELQLPDGTTEIPASAFAYCVDFTVINIPVGVTDIGSRAFYQCKSVVSITLPDSLNHVETGAFNGCANNKEVHISDIASWCEITFEDAYANPAGYNNSVLYLNDQLVENLEIPSGVKKIGAYAFKGCYSLKSITLPDSVTSIGAYAFNNCFSLTKLTLPAKLSSIGNYAFSNCTSLYTVTFPEKMDSIGDYAFMNCVKLRELTLPQWTSVGMYAFYGCTGLEEVVFSLATQSIGNYAFSGCSNLWRVWFICAPPVIATNAFVGVTAEAFYDYRRGWTVEEMLNYGGTLTWKPATLVDSASVDEASETYSLKRYAPKVRSKSVIGGEYESEDLADYTLKTATFTGLVAGEDYVMLVMTSITVEDPISADNLLYIKQATAPENGTLVFRYVQRVDTEWAYVMLCGGPAIDLSDATVTFPEMNSSLDAQVVKPTVEYNGEILIEGEDYTISGAVDYAAAGQYTCYIKGIYDYTGSIECTYTVNGEKLRDLGFVSASLTLQNNLAVDFKVDKALFDQVGYSDPYVEFQMGERRAKVTDYTVVGDRYVFRFDDITPNRMNDTISATLYAEYGQRIYFSQLREYSVATYCYNMLERCTDSAYAKLRTLLVDLLNYGAASQKYSSYCTDDLVNNRLTSTQMQWATAADPVLGSVQDVAYETVTNPSVTWKSATLSLQDAVVVRVRFLTESTAGVTLKVKTDYAEWTIPASSFTESNGVYTVDFEDLCAGQMRDSLYLTFYKNGVPVSDTLRYSIETYAYKYQNVTDGYLGELMKAMMKYGDAAYAYAMYLKAG